MQVKRVRSRPHINIFSIKALLSIYIRHEAFIDEIERAITECCIAQDKVFLVISLFILGLSMTKCIITCTVFRIYVRRHIVMQEQRPSALSSLAPQ